MPHRSRLCPGSDCAQVPQKLPLTPVPMSVTAHWQVAGEGGRGMDHKGLAREVAERTGLSREESADITWAVLEGLADQLSEGEARRLAAELPDLAEQLHARRRRRKE